MKIPKLPEIQVDSQKINKPYSGVLKKPIYRGSTYISVLYDFDRIWDERIAKFKALFEHFGINGNGEDSLERLAVALAIKHVPGMQVQTRGAPPGRRRQWSIADYRQLRALIDGELKKAPNLTIGRAISKLVKEQGQRDLFKGDPKSLATRYHEAKKAIEQYDRVLAYFRKKWPNQNADAIESALGSMLGDIFN